MKRQRASSGAKFDDGSDMRWIREEITTVREGLERIVIEAREDRRAIKSTLKKLLDQTRRKT